MNYSGALAHSIGNVVNYVDRFAGPVRENMDMNRNAISFLGVHITLLLAFNCSGSAEGAENAWRKDINKGEELMRSGKYEKALKHLNAALKSAEEIKAEDDLTAQSLSKIGDLYRRQCKYQEAEEYYKKALKRREQTLTPESEAIRRNLVDLCYCLWDQRKFEELKPVLSRMMALSHKQGKQDYDELERPVYLMARIYWDNNQCWEAVEYLDQIVEIRKKAYGTNSLKVAEVYDDFGRLFRDQ